MTKSPPLKQSQKGFTIVEIMIATTILSVILLLASVVMIGLGRLYYKGINTNRVQDNTRAISDEISQQLQLSGANLDETATTPSGIKAYCIGNIRYTFILNRRLGANDPARLLSLHVLWRDKTPGSGCITNDNFFDTDVPMDGPAQPSENGVELIATNSRLTAFTISPSSPYTITIGEVFGDDDVFSGAGIATTCNGGIAGQFCATATAVSTVSKRIVD